MARHHPDLVMCRKQPGVSLARLCEKCDGKCPVCDSYVRPTAPVKICDECAFGGAAARCVVCSAPGASDAYYCKECVQQEKDVRLARGRAAARAPRCLTNQPSASSPARSATAAQRSFQWAAQRRRGTLTRKSSR